MTYADGTPNLSYAYDPVGNLLTAAAGSVVTNFWNYSSTNQPQSSSLSIGGQTYNFTYGYDLAGDLLSETYPSGRVVTANYDIAQRPLTLSGAAGGTTTPYVQTAGYWPHGAVYYWQYGNNVWPVEFYTKLLQPSASYSTLNNAGQPVHALHGKPLEQHSDGGHNRRKLWHKVPASSMTQ